MKNGNDKHDCDAESETGVVFARRLFLNGKMRYVATMQKPRRRRVEHKDGMTKIQTVILIKMQLKLYISSHKEQNRSRFAV